MLRITKSKANLFGLLVATVLTVTLVSVGLSFYTSAITRGREAALKVNLQSMNVAIDAYHTSRNRYPSSLKVLVNERYIRAIPSDPFTNSTETWQVELSGTDHGSSSARPGVVKVRSGSDRLALDGTRYSDW